MSFFSQRRLVFELLPSVAVIQNYSSFALRLIVIFGLGLYLTAKLELLPSVAVIQNYSSFALRLIVIFGLGLYLYTTKYRCFYASTRLPKQLKQTPPQSNFSHALRYEI